MSLDVVNDVILIRFLAGTGGSFLKNLLLAAKRNIKEDFTFSKSGNAHTQIAEELNYHILIEDLKCQQLLKTVDDLSDPPFFVMTHCHDQQLCVSQFTRVITITYTREDADAIIKLVEKKLYNDDLKVFDHVTLEDGSIISIEDWRRGRLPRTIAKIPLWTQPADADPNTTLFISFRELLYGHPNALIEKLSLFTGIPPGSFSKKNLQTWRELTYHSIW
jgi:hypothetical protein